MNKYGSLATLFLAVTALAACKADRVIVEVDEAAIQDAIAGGVGEAEFAATFEMSGELDERKQQKLDQIEQIVRSNMDVSEFLVTGDGSNTQVEIEGYLPVSSDRNEAAAWFLLAEQFGEEADIVRVATGSQYLTLFRQIEAVDSSFGPDAFHPTTIRFRASGANITVPAGYVDGEPRVMWSTTVDGRVSLRFADGIFDDVGGAFIVRN